MPTVKRYEPGQVEQKVAPLVERQVKGADIAAPHRAVAKSGLAVANLGTQIARAASTIDDRKDKAAAKQAYVSFGDEIRDLHTDYGNRTLKTAMGSTSEFQKEIDKTLEKAAGSLENDYQRDLFRSLAYTKRGSALDKQATHEAHQLKEWEAATSSAMANESIQYAAENYTIVTNGTQMINTAVIKDMKKNIELAVATAGVDLDATILADQTKAQVSMMHYAVLNTMLVDENTKMANDYFEKYNDEILEDVSGKKLGLKKRIETYGKIKESQIKADEIFLETLNYEDQLGLARDIGDPEVRDATVARIKARKVETDKVEDDQKRDRLDAQTNEILDIHKNGGAFEAALEIAAKNPNGSERLKLRKIAMNIFTKEDTVTFPDKFVEVMTRIDSRIHKKGPINSLNQLYLEYKPYLSNSDFDQVTAYWQKGGSIGGLTDNKVKSIYKNLTGKDPNKSKSQAKAYKGIWDYVVDNLPEGKKPTDKEVKALITQAVVDGERQGGGFGYGADTTYLEAQKRGHDSTWLPDVTNEERDAITKKLKDIDEPVSDFTIRLYKRLYMLELPMTQELKDTFNKDATVIQMQQNR